MQLPDGVSLAPHYSRKEDRKKRGKESATEARIKSAKMKREFPVMWANRYSVASERFERKSSHLTVCALRSKLRKKGDEKYLCAK